MWKRENQNLPGSRVEVGKYLLFALRSENGKESDIQITDIKRLGFLQLRYKMLKSILYPCPCSDFFRLVFSCSYNGKIAIELQWDDYEMPTANT